MGDEAVDVAFVFQPGDGPVIEYGYHREIVAKESGFLREKMPPPNEVSRA